MGAYWERCHLYLEVHGQEVEGLTRAVSCQPALGTMAVEQRTVEHVQPELTVEVLRTEVRARHVLMEAGAEEGGGRPRPQLRWQPTAAGRLVAAADSGARCPGTCCPPEITEDGGGCPGGGRLPAPLPTITADAGGTPGGGRLGGAPLGTRVHLHAQYSRLAAGGRAGGALDSPAYDSA